MIGKIMLITEFMTPQPGKQTMAMYILPDISKEVKAIRH